jgi:hypothetical protein
MDRAIRVKDPSTHPTLCIVVVACVQDRLAGAEVFNAVRQTAAIECSAEGHQLHCLAGMRPRGNEQSNSKTGSKDKTL